jgi:hypothetical protein
LGNRSAKGKFGRCWDEKDKNTIIICPTGPGSIETLIEDIIKYIFYISLLVVPLLILYASFLIMTAGGEEARIRKGRGIIVMASIGLAVILLAKVFYGLIRDIIQNKP